MSFKDTSKKLGSGALVTGINGLLYKIIVLFSLPKELTELFVYSSTPIALIISYYILLFIGIWGTKTPEDAAYQAQLKKEKKKWKKIINCKKSTTTEIRVANEHLEKVLNLEVTISNKKLTKLASASLESSPSILESASKKAS